MELLGTFFSEQMIQRIGWVLIHFLWQATAIAVLLWCVLKAMSKVSSNTHYVAACMGLVLMVAAPVVTFILLAEDTTSVAAVPLVAAEPKPVSITIPVTETEAETVEQFKSNAGPKRTLSQYFVDRLEAALPYCVVVWTCGVGILSIWYLGGWCQLQKLRWNGTKVVSDEVQANTSLLSQRLGLRRAVSIAESALVQVPTVIGWLKPMILMPATALTGLDEIQLQAMIAHELAHIRRCDYLVNIVQTIVEILGFYHPAVWWASHQIRIERENCCDDMAVILIRNRKEYAGALFTMEAIRSKQHELVVAANGGHLTNRINRLAGKSTEGHKSGWVIAIIIMGLIMTGCVLRATNRQNPDHTPEKKTEAIDPIEQADGIIESSASSDTISNEQSWGKATNGVSVRLHSPQVQWFNDHWELYFKTDLKSETERVLPYYGAPIDEFLVEYDKQWYKVIDNFADMRSIAPSRGTLRQNLHTYIAAKHWQSILNDQPMPEITPGQHIIRISFPLSDRSDADGLGSFAVSNPVEIVIDQPMTTPQATKGTRGDERDFQNVTPPQLLINTYLVSASSDWPQLENIIFDDKTQAVELTSKQLDAFLETIKQSPDAKILANPKILINDKQLGQISSESDDETDDYMKWKFVPHTTADLKSLRLEIEFEQSQSTNSGRSSTSMATMAKLQMNNALVISGIREMDSTISFLLVKVSIIDMKSPVDDTKTTVKGQVLDADGAPVTNQQVELQVFKGGDVDDIEDNYSSYITSTDEGGQFLFEAVDPGDAHIGRFFQAESIASVPYGLGHSIKIQGGKDYTITLGGKGRPVIGRLLPASGNTTGIDWSKATMDLNLEAAPYSMGFATDNAKVYRAMVESDGSDLYSRDNIVIHEDGSFQINNVRAGRYMLRVLLPEHPMAAGGFNLFHKFTVDLMSHGTTDDPLNLGDLTVSHDDYTVPAQTDTGFITDETIPIAPARTIPFSHIIESSKENISENEEKQIAIEARFMLVNDAFLEDIGLDGSLTTDDEVSDDIDEVVIGLANSKDVLSALKHIPLAERQLPELLTQKVKTLDDLQNKFILKAAQTSQNTKVITAPKAVVLNNEFACFQVQTESSYIDIDDEICYVESGITLEIQPICQNENKEVLLKGYMQMTDVLENRSIEHNGKTYEIPYVQVVNIPIHAIVESPGTVLIAGPEITTTQESVTNSGLSNISLLRRFSNNSVIIDKQKLLLLIKPTVITQE